MRKRSRRRRPKRSAPRGRGQRRHKLSKKAQELYPPGAASGGETAEEAWEDELQGAVGSLQPRGGSRRVAPDGRTPEGRTPDGRTPEGRTPEGRTPEGRTPEGRTPEGRTPEGRTPEGRTPDAGDRTAGPLRRGRVVAPSSGACRIESGGRLLDCVLPSAIAHDQQQRLAAGDEVLFAPPDAGAGPEAPPRLVEVLPRRTFLSRPDPRNPRRERVIAANVDVVVQVVSFRRPPLRTALIDRCLIAVERGGAAGLICANKVDLVPAAERRRELAPVEAYRDLGLEVAVCSAETGEGVANLRRRLAGTTAVFVGHSGVGKSSLLNALDPELEVETRAVSGLGRGRHTTTRSRLYRLAGDIRVIDTPGIRELGLFELTAAELPAYFPDLVAHAGGCRFNDCRHHREPDCAVRAAVEAGDIRAARYETYLRILDSLA